MMAAPARGRETIQVHILENDRYITKTYDNN
jgi:hypothetical protein